MKDYQNCFEIVRYSLDSKAQIPKSLANVDWIELYQFSTKQAILGVVFEALIRLSENGIKPPHELLLRWIAEIEQIEGQNRKLDKECQRLTKLFELHGHKTAILKGQANAILYPKPLRRQSGDIDIYVDGGEFKVMQTLFEIGLIPKIKIGDFEGRGNALKSYHHVHLPTSNDGIEVEIHFRPGSGVSNPFYNRRIQKFLTKEVFRGSKMIVSGFVVPSIRFALIMQLAHIQTHFVKSGIGLRQLIDYYYLLQHYESDNDMEIAKEIRFLGLVNIAGAVMWVLKEILGIEEKFLIVPVDKKRGKLLLDEIIRGGNFGKYSAVRSKNALSRFLGGRSRYLRILSFDFGEIIWSEFNYLKMQVKKSVIRIRRRRWNI